MAASVTKLFIICLSLTVSTLIHCHQLVPCMFIFGDSLFDNGNNNNLNTKAKVNYFPYGIDFPGGIPTGRFSNGKNAPDFLDSGRGNLVLIRAAEFLGLNELIPPFATASGIEIFKGVNYASGGAGILDDSGRFQGERISMNLQLANHGTVVSEIARILGSATLAEEHLKTCLYITHMGINDYINNYLMPQYFQTSTLYTPQQYAALLIKHYSQQLKILYNYGARKVAVFEPGLAGCLPAIVSNFPTNGSSCNTGINDIVQLFSKMLKTLVETLNTSLANATFIFLDFSSISSVEVSLAGIRNTNGTCCISTTSNVGLCDADKLPCDGRKEYMFWDKYHPTEYASFLLALRAYKSLIITL